MIEEKKLFIFTLMFAVCFGRTDAAKIIMLPVNINSHMCYFSELGEGLSKLGHTVEMFAPSNAHIPYRLTNANFTVTTYKVDSERPFMNSRELSDGVLRVAMENSFWSKRQMWLVIANKCKQAFESDCIALMSNQNLMQKIASAGFQFAIIDPSLTSCNYLVLHSNTIPYASFWVSRSPLTFRVPRLSSFTSQAGFSDEMTFTQRLLTFFYDCFEYYSIYTDSNTNFPEAFAPNKYTSSHDVIQNSSLYLYLEDVAAGFARPNMPNTLSIGDIMAGQPLKPIPQILETFVNESTEGVILVSFGSYFDHVPEFLAQGFCNAFRQLKYQVIWKLNNGTVCGNIENVKIVSWVPQNELLAHPKILLFITQGGINSVIESVYHAKPIIVFPMVFDQLGNAGIAAARGYGIRMDVAEFRDEELLANIEKIMTDPSFANNARLASAILKDKQYSAAERVSFMVNHVLKHGDKHLRTGAYKLSLFQFLMFDIFLAIVGSISVLIFILFSCFYCCFRFAKSWRLSILPIKTKHE